MTAQKTSIASSNLDIIYDNEKLYFSDYQDFPIFEKTIFPPEAWDQMDINIDILCENILAQQVRLKNMHDLLKDEFQDVNTPDDRAEFLRLRKSEDYRIVERFEELTDPSYVVPVGKKKEINEEAHRLHLFIKYFIFSDDYITQFKDCRVNMLLTAHYDQGYDVDPFIGEITRV